MADYGNPDFWDRRYKRAAGRTFDWLETYSAIKPFIEHLFPARTIKTLILGCGNSPFSEEMYDDGYHDIMNIDISHTVISQMRERNRDRHSMTFTVGDVMAIEAPDNQFDLAIDKSTVDTLLCSQNSFENVATTMKEA
jgi:hypothetical protein